MIFIDTETTGLLKPGASEIFFQPYITEITAIKVDDNLEEVLGTVNTLVKPPIPIPPEIVRAIGITDDDVKDAPRFCEIYQDLVDLFLGESTIVAHNVSFDVQILANELFRIGLEYHFPWPSKHICTVEASKDIRGHRLKLMELHKIATGEGFEGSHRSLNDVHALIRCYEWLREKGMVP